LLSHYIFDFFCLVAFFFFFFFPYSVGYLTNVQNNLDPADPALFNVGGPMSFQIDYDRVYREIHAEGVSFLFFFLFCYFFYISYK
jgi:hypothetical protein